MSSITLESALRIHLKYRNARSCRYATRETIHITIRAIRHFRAQGN